MVVSKANRSASSPATALPSSADISIPLPDMSPSRRSEAFGPHIRRVVSEGHQRVDVGVPHEVAADRAPQLELIADLGHGGEVGRHLTVVEADDGELEPLVLWWRRRSRRDRVAALGRVAVLRGEADVHVLTGAVA